MREFTVLIEKDEDGWLVSSVLELPGCHTQGKTLDELMERTKEATEAYLEVIGEKPEILCTRIKGSHHVLKNQSGKIVVAPVHGSETLGIGLIRRILADVDISTQDFTKYFGE